jgi:hypothetical protein
MLRPRIREAGDAALVAELPARIDPMTNAAVLRLAERIRTAAVRAFATLCRRFARWRCSSIRCIPT